MSAGRSSSPIHDPVAPCLIARLIKCPFAARRRYPGSCTVPDGFTLRSFLGRILTLVIRIPVAHATSWARDRAPQGAAG
jgi:hypothetical protein